MITLSVDVGNTRAKVGIFENNALQQVDIFSTQELLKIPKNYEYDYAIVSSVDVLPSLFSQAFGKKKLFLLNHQTKIPFVNAYQTPNTLGSDRLAAIAGAYALYPRKNVLVIDLGSCITYDFIDNNARYLGGGISPGLQMRLKAMHTFTAKLPLVNVDLTAKTGEDIPLIGNNTTSSLISGAIMGAAAEITQMIRMYSNKFADLQIILCGGDATFLTKQIPVKTRVIPDLVLAGLNSILLYNLNNSVDRHATLY
jgi:type III pantothenate kinase